MSIIIDCDDNDRIFIMNTDEFVQIPPDEPSMRFITESIDEDKITMRIEAKMPRFLIKKEVINE